MTSSTQRRLVFAGLLVLGVVAGWFLLGRRPATSADATSNVPSTPPSVARSTAVASDATTSAPPAATKSTDDITDFRAALEAARGLSDRLQRSREFGRILRLWLERDLEAALAYVRAMRQAGEFTQGMLMVLDAVAQRDPDRALALAAELAITREQRSFYSSFFARLAQSDLPSAVTRLALVPAGDSRGNALRAVADVWAQTDLPAALAWAQQLPAGDRAIALESTLQTLLLQDPLRAIELAHQFLDGPALERTLGDALRRLTEINPQGAAGIVVQLPLGETQTFAALGVARALAAGDPGAALAWIKTLPAGETQRLALNNALDSWVAVDSAAAGSYVAQMPPGAAQDVAADHFARLVGARDPQTAIAWAQALTSESARQTALITIGSAWAQHAPAAATAWAMTLPAGAVQTGALSGAFSYWLQRDAPAAQSWLATANLSADVEARLLPPRTR